MMRPDANVAIAYGSTAMKLVAEMLRDKLVAYQKKGYPVSVSIIAEDIKKMRKNVPAGKSVDTLIREKMEKYFSDFDYAIFLFDEKGQAIPEGNEEPTPLVSSNLIFEYGLASSTFINQELKHIYCFAPKEISGAALQYIMNLNLKTFSNLFDDEESVKDNDAITNMIIQEYIHYHVYTCEENGKSITVNDGIWFSFYGLPEKLPKLQRDEHNNYYLPDGCFKIRNPMDLTKNVYWADMRKLQPSGIRVSLDEQDEALNQLFIKEYQRFTASGNQTESILGRQLLYVVDRAVFIMYLRQEDYWSEVADELENLRLANIKRNTELEEDQLKTAIDDDYYLKAIHALKGVFLYQKCSRPVKDDKPFSGKLFEKLETIQALLEPVVSLDSTLGNRMVFCMATDYLALCYHKLATKQLGQIIGQKEFCLDNDEHIAALRTLLRDKKQVQSKESDLKKVLNNFGYATALFDKVVTCQENMQSEINHHDYKYIWKSYALYNQARCEFMIHLIEKIFVAETNQQMDFVSSEIRSLGEKWNKNLRDAVNSRHTDYTYFKDRPLFPQFITFNLQAEYYHAFYEYELSCLIEQQLDNNFIVEPFNEYEKFQDWKENNLTISDVLSVDGKVARLNKLKEKYFEAEAEKFMEQIKSRTSDKKKGALHELLLKMKMAVVTEDEDAYETVTTKGIEFGPEISLWFMKLKAKFFYSKTKKKKNGAEK